MNDSENTPKISILVAARNEEKNILNLLQSLVNLTYPKNQVEILIGNDDSTDKTEEIVQSFIADKPEFSLYNIPKSSNHLKGKTNVLAFLATHASGNYFFYTDADIQVPTSWINAMLNAFKKNIGVVVGATTTVPSSLFARMQGIEWLCVLKFMETLANFNVKSTGMGNNMAVTAEAYQAVGGYNNLPFSIVEDFALYQAIIKKGFGFGHVYSTKVLAFTQPPENYFQQRKRWVSGAVNSRTFLLILALIQALLLPFFISQFFINKEITSYLFLIYFTITLYIGSVALLKMKLKKWLVYLPIYAVFSLFSSFLQLINYLLPTKLSWKSRNY